MNGTDESRISSLDGWRGISILLVLADHLSGVFGRRILGPWSFSGQHGVTIFFVLSGFLITSKLLTSPRDLSGFYIRRFFRLLPVTWVYLLFLVILGTCLRIPTLGAFDLLSCVAFFRNFIEPQTSYTPHFWSLSIEEQYYLVWPSILLLCGPRTAKWVAFAGALGCAGYRLANYSNYQGMRACQTQVRADALLIGCLLALLVAEPDVRSRIARWSNYLAIPAAVVFLFCAAYFLQFPPFAECVAIAVLLAASTLHPKQRLATVLSISPLRWLGRISYSIYVWNFIFFMMSSPGWEGVGMFALMWLFAISSYYFVEKPCTQIGHRLTGRSSKKSPLKQPVLLAPLSLSQNQVE